MCLCGEKESGPSMLEQRKRNDSKENCRMVIDEAYLGVGAFSHSLWRFNLGSGSVALYKCLFAFTFAFL